MPVESLKSKIKRRLREKQKQRLNASLKTDKKPIYIAITRFNADTWYENQSYREKTGIKGCLYGSPIPITHKIPSGATVYVLEMNNSSNEIEGIGRIVNSFNLMVYRAHNYKIYNDKNYSRYVYKGAKRIDKADFSTELNLICWFLEWMLFFGYGPLDKPRRGTHLKRGMGINRLPLSLLKVYKNKLLNLDIQLKYFFEAATINH